MSRAHAAALALAFGVLVPAAAAGQTRARLDARVRTFEAMQVVATRNRVRADSIRRAAFDTLRDGPVTLLAHRKIAAAARAGLRGIVPLIQSTYGDAAAALGVATHTTPPMTLADSTLTELRARWEIGHHTERRMAPPSGHPWYPWTGNALIAPFSLEELQDGLQRTYVTLVTTPSPANAGCFDGTIAQCRVALELSPVIDRPLQWFSAEQRRSMAQSVIEQYPMERSSLALQNCARGSDAACIDAMRSGDLTMWPPLGGSDRVALTRFVLTNGDAGAYARLTAPARDMSEVIERVAGAPIDSVVARWRAAVLVARPKRTITSSRTAWAAVFWTVLVGALSLRSTRWRRI